jgi:predicted anti-sigma-YlaC factor YlaD
MSEHFTTQQVERYLGRAMSPAELLAATDHLATCEACRKLLGEAKQLHSSLTSLRADLQAIAGAEPVHLQYEELAAYLDGRADPVDREILESHLQICQQCMAEAQDLRTFKSEMSANSDREYAPVTTTLRERLAAFWRAPFWRAPAYWIPIQTAATAAIVILFVWIATSSLRTEVAGLRAEVSNLRQANDELQAQASSVPDLKAQLAELQQRQAEALGSSPQVAVALYDGGGLLTLDKQGNLTGLESLPQQYRQTIKAALLTGRVDTPAEIAGLAGKAGRLMGGSGEGISFALLSPVGTVVETDRPTFRWRPLNGATVYAVNVYDSDFNKVASSQQLSAAEWTAAGPLRRGGMYSWQVTAIRDGKEITSPAPPAPEARFKVLEQPKATEIENAEHSFASSHLVLGILYKQTGLLDDAEREFKALLAANPKSSIAQKLLSGVQALRSNNHR